MHPVYITGAGKFLPNDPVSNAEIEDRLGTIHGKPSRVRERILKNNGIRTRHYAIDKQGRPTHSNAEIAELAIRDAVGRSGRQLAEVDLICAATTMPDLLVPGFASMVHGRLPEVGPAEVLSSMSVCCAAMAGLSSAYAQVALGRRRCAVSVGSERASAFMRGRRFEETLDPDGERLCFDAEFLRWMLSDGAGAFLLTPEPLRDGLSLRLDWIEVVSHAHDHPVCMYLGCETDRPDQSWTDLSPMAAAQRGHMSLRQDVRNVNEVIALMCSDFCELVDAGRVDVQAIDHFLVHYSSHFFRGDVMKRLADAGIAVPEEKWFTNLYTRGNTGNASIYLMLEELLNEHMLSDGDTIVCLVPESGRYTTAHMQLTAVEGKAQ